MMLFLQVIHLAFLFVSGLRDAHVARETDVQLANPGNYFYDQSLNNWRVIILIAVFFLFFQCFYVEKIPCFY